MVALYLWFCHHGLGLGFGWLSTDEEGCFWGEKTVVEASWGGSARTMLLSEDKLAGQSLADPWGWQEITAELSPQMALLRARPRGGGRMGKKNAI